MKFIIKSISINAWQIPKKATKFFIYFIEVGSTVSNQECKHIAARYQQRNENTRVCTQCPLLDTFVKCLAFTKLSFKKAQVRPLSF